MKTNTDVFPEMNTPTDPAVTDRNAPEETTVNDRLLSEIERQEKYLNRLPNNFTFPLFNARQALESQRRSGYRNTASAAREIVDNAIEAGATRIHVIYDSGREDSGIRTVKAIAFIDNGPGMLPRMARYALSWGGGTHFDDPNFIGKFGFGLPNASINQSRRTEVYTRTSKDLPFTKAWLNIDDYDEFGLQDIAEPEEAELPEFVQRYLREKKISLDHGTVVIWSAPDRLSYKKPAVLKDHMVDDFGVTYRYLLTPSSDPESSNGQGIELIVESMAVQPVDPQFLMPEGRYYLPPHRDESGELVIDDDRTEGGARLAANLFLPVVYTADPDTGERHLKRLSPDDEVDPKDENVLAVGTINVRIARFPLGFVVYQKKKRDEKTDANRRFDIRQSRRGMAFVRSGREIQTVDLFPRRAQDEASGLGAWPLLQAYAYHWGVEVRFGAELDEIFGITNDKQGVRPIEDFWRVLAEAEVDQLLHNEQNWQVKTREKEKVKSQPEGQSTETPSPAEKAAQSASAAEGDRPTVPPLALTEARTGLENEAQRRAGVTAESIQQALEALEKEQQRRRYRIDFYEAEDGPIYKPEWCGSQIVIYINRWHPFYQLVYRDMLNLPDAQRAKEGLDLLLIALGKPEITATDSEMRQWYEVQRKQRWSPFLETSLESLRQNLGDVETGEHEEEETFATSA